MKMKKEEKCNHDIFNKNNSLNVTPEIETPFGSAENPWVEIDCKICNFSIEYNYMGERYNEKTK